MYFLFILTDLSHKQYFWYFVLFQKLSGKENDGCDRIQSTTSAASEVVQLWCVLCCRKEVNTGRTFDKLPKTLFSSVIYPAPIFFTELFYSDLSRILISFLLILTYSSIEQSFVCQILHHTKECLS